MTDGLFVLLDTWEYHLVEKGIKDVILRDVSDKFHRGTVTPGRQVEIRQRNSGGHSCWGEIGNMWTFGRLDSQTVDEHGPDYNRIVPGVTQEEFVDVIEGEFGYTGPYIAFVVNYVSETLEETLEKSITAEQVEEGISPDEARQRLWEAKAESAMEVDLDPDKAETLTDRLFGGGSDGE